jgi:hypothetical protein
MKKRVKPQTFLGFFTLILGEKILEIVSKNKRFGLCFLCLTLWSIDVWAAEEFDLDFPDLMSTELNSDFIRALKAHQGDSLSSLSSVQSNSSLKELDLSGLEKGLKENQILSSEQRARLLVLLQELQGRPDDAYLTLKSLKESPKDMWYNVKELELSERLGLMGEVKRLGQDLSPVLFKPEFKIEKSVFCRSVKAFGEYEPLSTEEISSGQLMILYVEVLGLHQELKSEKYHSRCLASFDVFNESKIKVFSYAAPTAFEDICYSKRQESYLWMKWRPGLLPGKYFIKVRLQDDLLKKEAEWEHSFDLK